MNSNNTGFTKRFFATLTDSYLSFAMFLLIFVIFSVTVTFSSLTELAVTGALVLSTFIFVNFVVNYLYHIYFTAHFGGTLGKILFGIQVVDRSTGAFIDTKTAFWRVTAGYIFSGAFLGLGFWKIIKHPQKLSYHDQLFNTQVKTVRNPVGGILVLLILPVVFMLSLYVGTRYIYIKAAATLPETTVVSSNQPTSLTR